MVTLPQPEQPAAHLSAPELSIVMPCLNEALTVATCVHKALDWMARTQVHGEVIIADNGSTDGSQQLAEQAGARVVAVAARGYGAALQGGIAAACGRYVIMGDADNSYDFGNLTPFLTDLRRGTQLVMGNRFAGGIAPGAMPALHRYLGNPVLTAIGRVLFRAPVRDFHCGLRGFERAAILGLNLQTTGMEFASEMVVKATLYGLRISEVPTTLVPDGRDRPPHLRSWRDGWRHLRFLLLYSPRWLFLLPGLALMLGGTLAGLWLLPGPRSIFDVRLDVHTLLYAAAAVVIGFQAVIFALLTKVFAVSAGLLPDDQRVSRLARIATLEWGLAISALLLIGGVFGTLWALGVWGGQDFGDLDPVRTLRLVIPAVTLLVLGFQLLLSSFFLSILGLRRRTPS